MRLPWNGPKSPDDDSYTRGGLGHGSHGRCDAARERVKDVEEILVSARLLRLFG